MFSDDGGTMKDAMKANMKKIAKWVVVSILWPILRELLVEFGKQLIKLMADGVKALLAKWFDADIKTASSEAERQALRLRYEERIKDIDDVAIRMTDNMDEVVRQALLESEAKRDSVLEAGAPPKQLIEAGDA